MPVCKPDIDLIKNKVIIVAIRTYTSWLEVRQRLLDWGFKERLDFFHYVDFKSIFELYHTHRLVIERANIVVTNHCTLRCRDCILKIAHFKKRPQLTYEDVKKNIDDLFYMVDYVYNVHLVGGEPMLCRELPEFLKYLGERYEGHYKQLMILTNATIIPDSTLIEVCRKYNVHFQISDYRNSEGFTGISKVEEIEAILEREQISYEFLDMAYWYDYSGNLEEAEMAGKEALIEFMETCNTCALTVCNGRVYPCHASAAKTWGDVYPEPIEDSIPLLEIKSKAEYMEMTLGYWPSGVLDGCKYCYSDIPLGKKIIPAAIQMK